MKPARSPYNNIITRALNLRLHYNNRTVLKKNTQPITLIYCIPGKLTQELGK